MRTTIRKWFWAWEYDKEEHWLNDMAEQGKALVSARYATYEFEDSEPGEYVIRLEMLEKAPSDPESQQYIEFVESTGAEYVGKVMKWVYFRMRKADGEFQLHGDNATRGKQLQRIISLLKPLMAINIGMGLYNLCIGIGLNSAVNIFCACMSGAVAWLLYHGLVKLNEKKKQLEKESQLFE